MKKNTVADEENALQALVPVGRTVLVALMTFILSTIAVSESHAQVSIAALNSTYTNTFDGVGSDDFLLTDDITGPLIGFYALRDVGNTNPNYVTADNGSSTAEGFKNYGPLFQSDRSLGSLPGSGTGRMRFGVRFVNNTGTTVGSIRVSFTGEQWFNSGGQAPQTLLFAYRRATNVNDLFTGTYTPVPALNFVSPNVGPVQGAVDGNSPANRQARTATFAVAVAPGEEIMLRWDMEDSGGPNHGLAIDDLTVTAQGGSTAAPASIEGRVVDASGRGIANARVVLSSEGSVVARSTTGTFGYYRFDNVASGRGYVLQAESKRHRFDNPVLFVSLIDNLTGLDFVASP